MPLIIRLLFIPGSLHFRGFTFFLTVFFLLFYCLHFLWLCICISFSNLSERISLKERVEQSTQGKCCPTCVPTTVVQTDTAPHSLSSHYNALPLLMWVALLHTARLVVATSWANAPMRSTRSGRLYVIERITWRERVARFHEWIAWLRAYRNRSTIDEKESCIFASTNSWKQRNRQV